MRNLLIFIWLIVPLRMQPDALTVMAQANAAYANGNYQEAVQLYESLVESGLHDPTLYFNLGNTYYQLRDRGRSMLNYRRAQLFWPRDNELNRNLMRLMSERIDLLGDETGFWEGLAASTVNILTLSELSGLVLLLWFGCFGMVAAALLRQEWRNGLRLPLAVVGCILLIGLLLLGSRIFVNNMRPPGVILDDAVQVMSGPGSNYLRLYQLHAAADLHIWDEQDGWVKFALPDGRMGWLPQDSVAFVQE